MVQPCQNVYFPFEIFQSVHFIKVFFWIKFYGNLFSWFLVYTHPDSAIGSLAKLPINFILLKGIRTLNIDIKFKNLGLWLFFFFFFLSFILTLLLISLQFQFVNIVRRLAMLIQIRQQINVHYFRSLFFLVQRILVSLRIGATVRAKDNFSRASTLFPAQRVIVNRWFSGQTHIYIVLPPPLFALGGACGSFRIFCCLLLKCVINVVDFTRFTLIHFGSGCQTVFCIDAHILSLLKCNILLS